MNKEKIETNVIKPDVSFLENDVVYLILNALDESILDSKVDEIKNFMKEKWGKGKSSEEKDSLYEEAKVLWHDFMRTFKETKYNFYLNRQQYNFLTTLILQKLEYDVNTVFFAIELTNLLGVMKEAKFSNDKDLAFFPVNATEITYIYHLISKHTVKGLVKDAYTFSQVLIRIGGISKVFNYYETLSKSLSNDIQTWVISLDDGVIVDNLKDIIPEQKEVEVVEVIEPLKPKKEKNTKIE
jgi:hypothetical protein